MFSQKIILVIAVCFLIVLSWIIFLILPKYQNLNIIQQNIKERNAELQNKEEYFTELYRVHDELENYEEELSKIDSALPSKLSMPSLFDFLQKASSQSGLFLQSISPIAKVASEKNSNIFKNTFSITVAGSYGSFKNLLSVLEKSARLIEVENISFSSPAETGSLFKFNLSLKVFSYQE